MQRQCQPAEVIDKRSVNCYCSRAVWNGIRGRNLPARRIIRLGRSAILIASLSLATCHLPHDASARPPVVSGGRYERQPQYNAGGYDWGNARLSGTLVRQSNATTTWYLYPGACVERAGGTWVPKTSPVADSLNTYTTGTTDSYTAADRSLNEKLWHVESTSTPATQRPAILDGTRSLWCGAYNPSWVIKVGYPDVTHQILYIDTNSFGAVRTSAGTYTVTLTMNLSLERDFDFLHLIGGGDGDLNGFGDEDPIGNNRATLEQVIATGLSGESRLLATWTGSVTPATPGATSINTPAAPVIRGGAETAPANVTATLTISAAHRSLYFVLVTDDHESSQDGLWPHGAGILFDNIATGDTGSLYAEQAAAGGTDATLGNILVADAIGGGETDGVRIAARVVFGTGELWNIQRGNLHPTNDLCALQKDLSSDAFFYGADAVTEFLYPASFAGITSCTFPVPAGTAQLRVQWNEYLFLPHGSGYVQFAEYRFFKDGFWSDWRGTAASNVRHAGGNESWATNADDLVEAVQADSVQIRWMLQCVPGYSTNKTTCSSTIRLGLLYDDLRLEVTTGVPAPQFGIFIGSVAQTTFVDGTMTGVNCAAAPCWPGIRGTDLGVGPGINDNFNSPIGDSITLVCASALRRNGMGINWRRGFDRTVDGGRTITHTNGAYNAAFGAPQMIYRLFDPATKSWSPYDSTELDADAVVVSGGGADTSVARSAFRVDWPPRDRAGLNLPGGFTINGVAAYNSLAFLPRGTRIQYYFKAVDIDGGIAYQFSTDHPALEGNDAPLLPGGWMRAPDIIEFQVLPGVYTAGAGGSLLAGRTDTPLLNLDGSYTSWSFGEDPVTKALYALGVRADRYRFLQGYVSGSNAGGHELAGDPIERTSNYFPNLEEYSIADSLARWYRILVQSSHLNTFPVTERQDAKLIRLWALSSTGADGGDRCVFASGDDYFNVLLNGASSSGEPVTLSSTVFGVGNVISLAGGAGRWAGTTINSFPTVDDRFAAAASGPGLAAPGSFAYEVDGGCPTSNRFDPLSPTAGGVASATYPLASSVTDVAAVSKSSEGDGVPDRDRTKALGYGLSLQFVRGSAGAIPRTSSSYVHSGVENRARILYKFLTGCRGARSGAPGDTLVCWPCPAPAASMGAMQANWAGQGIGFETAGYGPLYPIQDHTMATGVEEGPAPGAPPRVNALFQNRPNPFNPATVIPFTLASPGRVEIRVFDVAGRLVRTLVDAALPAGDHVARWNGDTNHGARAASGVYFYRIVYAGGEVSSRKMTILR